MSPPEHAENRPMPRPRSLRAGFHLLNQQTLVTTEREGDAKGIKRLFLRDIYGSNTLLIVATKNLSKIDILEEKIRGEMNAGELITYSFEPRTSAQQPYNKMGKTCLLERVEAMVEFADQNSHVLRENQIGTVIIGAIENYIHTSSTYTSGVDFGLVMLYNARTQCIVQGTSKGVPVEGEYLQEARSGGFWDGERNRGKITYGEILKKVFHEAAQREFGAGYDVAKDWHRAVCGISRYSLLRDVTQALDPIL
jgi:hypothetical protein